MNRRFGFILAWLVTSVGSGRAQTITPTPTFNNLGIVVTLPAPTTQSLVRMFLKISGAPTNDYLRGN